MERHEESEKDELVRARLRHVQRDAVYVRRSTPAPARQIVDVLHVWPAAQPPKIRPISPTTRPVPAVPARPVTIPPKSDIHQPQPRPQAKPKRRFLMQPAFLYAMAGVLVIAGGWLAYSGLIANKRVTEQVQQLSDKAEAADGSDENAPPATTPPTNSAVKNYSVAPNLPRYIDIPNLSVHARVLSMGVDSKGALKAPGNVFDAGWYNASAQPGQPGGMLIDGHISSWSTKGVFYGLNKLKTGDAITITRGDNKQFIYKVVSVETKRLIRLIWPACWFRQILPKQG